MYKHPFHAGIVHMYSFLFPIHDQLNFVGHPLAHKKKFFFFFFFSPLFLKKTISIPILLNFISFPFQLLRCSLGHSDISMSGI